MGRTEQEKLRELEAVRNESVRQTSFKRIQVVDLHPFELLVQLARGDHITVAAGLPDKEKLPARLGAATRHHRHTAWARS